MEKSFYRLTFEQEEGIPEEFKAELSEEEQDLLRPRRKDCDVEVYRAQDRVSVVIVQRSGREPIMGKIEEICSMVARREKFKAPLSVDWYEDHRSSPDLYFAKVTFDKFDPEERELDDPKWDRSSISRSSFYESIGINDPGQDISAYREHEEGSKEEAHRMITSWNQSGGSLSEKIDLLENDARTRSHLFSYYPQIFYAAVDVKIPGQNESTFAYEVDGAENLHALFLATAKKFRESNTGVSFAIVTRDFLKANYPNIEIVR